LEKLFFVQNEIFVLETATKSVTGLTFPPKQIDLQLTAPFALSLHWLALNCKHRDFRGRKRLLSSDGVLSGGF
jgi:hypothetical protein